MAKQKNVPNQPQAASATLAAIAPQGQIRRANVKREVTQSQAFVSIYSNDIEVQTTPWDVRLIFGTIQQLPDADQATAKVTQVADLHISPQLAKTLVMILVGQLRTYEQTIGEIPLPKD